MYTYDYESPRRPRVLGGDVVKRLPEILGALNASRVMILTSTRFARTEIVSHIRHLLGERLVDTFSEVEQHPSLAMIMRATDVARKARIDAVITLGGGSVIDSGKGVAWYLDEKAEVAPVRHIAMPSTLSGAEFTNTIGVTIDRAKHLLVHDRILADVVFLDPRVAVEMPRSLLSSSLLNAIDHAVEGVMSIDRSPMTDAISLHAIRMLRLAAQDLSQLSAIADAQTGAALSVMELSKVSVGLGHALAHVLGGRCGTPHSLNHGLVVAAVMRFNLPVVALQQRMIAEAFGVETRGLSDNAAAWKAVGAVKDLVHRMGAPKGLRELGVLESDLSILADMVMDDKYSHTNPRKVTPVEALEVLKWAWTGEIPPPDGL